MTRCPQCTTLAERLAPDEIRCIDGHTSYLRQGQWTAAILAVPVGKGSPGQERIMRKVG